MTKVPEIHSGQEALSMKNLEDIILDKILVEQLLAKLPKKEREMIWLWATQHTLGEIAEYLAENYNERPDGQMLSNSAVGVRIRNILTKLKSFIKDQ